MFIGRLNATAKEQTYIALGGRYAAKVWARQINIYWKGNVPGRRENKCRAEKQSATEKHLLGEQIGVFFSTVIQN